LILTKPMDVHFYKPIDRTYIQYKLRKSYFQCEAHIKCGIIEYKDTLDGVTN
jgi:hypothetical protein